MQLHCENGDGFLKYEAVKLPDTSNVWFNKTISLIECKKSCSNNCSCIAYASLDVREGGSGSLLWFRDLVDIRELVEGGQDLFIRLAVSELGTFLSHSISKLIEFSLIVSYKIDDNEEGSREDDMELPIYDLNTIANATGNFSDKKKLREGGFGPGYKGTLMDGQEIAVKRLSKCSGQGIEEFKNEVVLKEMKEC
ncbi:hypothetical protein Ddye_027124 [Dipteronia dyeriana]|uniref:Apple domain-containing protein n=1 Tax=Dipteronia dyeriana TaxID=168575 RepID=A0AAD9WPW2_9ROSI|nr:hypothetical protein Ddye_027124 [Dipteronia dyeriana]